MRCNAGTNHRERKVQNHRQCHVAWEKIIRIEGSRNFAEPPQEALQERWDRPTYLGTRCWLSHRNILFSIFISLFQKVEVLFKNTNIFSWPSFLASALWMQSALFVRNDMCFVHAFPGASTLPCIGFCHAALKNLFQLVFFRYTVLAKQFVRSSFVFFQKIRVEF